MMSTAGHVYTNKKTYRGICRNREHPLGGWWHGMGDGYPQCLFPAPGAGKTAMAVNRVDHGKDRHDKPQNQGAMTYRIGNL